MPRPRTVSRHITLSSPSVLFSNCIEEIHLGKCLAIRNCLARTYTANFQNRTLAGGRPQRAWTVLVQPAVAALMLLFPLIDSREAVRTDLACGVLVAAIAGAGHLLLGTFDLGLLTACWSEWLRGVYVGGCLAGRLPGATLRRIISLALLWYRRQVARGLSLRLNNHRQIAVGSRA